MKTEEKKIFKIFDSIIEKYFNISSPYAGLRKNLIVEIEKIGLKFNDYYQKLWDLLLKFLNEEFNYDYKTIVEIMIDERIDNFIYEIGFVGNIYLIGTIKKFYRYCKNDHYTIDRYYTIYGIKIDIVGIIRGILNSNNFSNELRDVDIERVIRKNSKIVYSHTIEEFGDCENCKIYDCEDDYEYEDDYIC